eukprot:362721-Chlamydomonas_euryale.AAC.3
MHVAAALAGVRAHAKARVLGVHTSHLHTTWLMPCTPSCRASATTRRLWSATTPTSCSTLRTTQARSCVHNCRPAPGETCVVLHNLTTMVSTSVRQLLGRTIGPGLGVADSGHARVRVRVGRQADSGDASVTGVVTAGLR